MRYREPDSPLRTPLYLRFRAAIRFARLDKNTAFLAQLAQLLQPTTQTNDPCESTK